MKITDFAFMDWMPLISKLFEIFGDKDFDYDDREATLDLVKMSVKQVGEELNWSNELITIRTNIAVNIFEEVFWHLKPKKNEPQLPI